MTSATFFFFFIPLLAGIFLTVNFLFAPHNTYQEKNTPFECGYHSFLGQNRTQFSISFFIFALLFLLFDLEILLVYPYAVSSYTNSGYGLAVMLIFFLALTLGFAFELGKNALKIDSRQMFTIFYNNYLNIFTRNAGFLLKYSSFNSKNPYLRATLLDYLNVIKSSIYDLKNIDIINVLKRNAKLRLSLYFLGLILFYVFELDNNTVNLILYGVVMCLVLHKFSKITNLKDFLYMLIQFTIFVLVLCLF